ncbi:MAG TPA: CPBP family glutamic-type intramembrane protease [Acidimicrobiales bacterium]|jgi:hypothetical protein|nr:CPBP family glutamic-type intramembrane protease [Acidimicrobiales bacterium]
MTALAPPSTRQPATISTAALAGGFVAAVGLRIALGGLGAARSVPAGLAFAAALVALSAARGVRLGTGWPELAVGVAGGAFICLPALAARVAGGSAHRPGGSFLLWAVVVAAVAAAEELFLRGALFDAVSEIAGRPAAIAAGAVAFAGLHVPLYGWHVVPLDLAVGIWLGALRTVTGSWLSPAVAHVTADLAGWWLR